ncbi:unnamed protein product [Cylicostephanus goldi]|uniref:Ammonium transporter AmtB-like domain-containing protein n=1 Tax=Cylicostephanus goldi TaxID=71465 RepID=A0A3P6RE07_CYLGO|nr:unnamed protein product [Cylicostephanus goldi]
MGREQACGSEGGTDYIEMEQIVEFYHVILNEIYPAMKSETNPNGTSAGGQALYQLAGLGLVLVGSIVSGMITGLILKMTAFNQVRDQEFYADGDYFETPADYDSTTKTVSRTDSVEINEQTQFTQKEV